MPSALLVLKRVIQPSLTAAKEEYRWEDILAAMRAVISAPLSSGAEHLLLSVLRFDGRIRLDASSEVPHSMPPEDMLKSLAVQALAKWTGPTYVRAMQRLQATATSPALTSVIRAVIQRMGQPRKQTDDLEEVAETSYEDPSNVRLQIRPVRQERGLTFWADRPVRRRELQAT
jgi:hypothetical protein